MILFNTRTKTGKYSLFVVFLVVLAVLLAGCPMPEPSPEPDPMTEPEPMTPGTMDAPTLEAGNGQLTVNWTPPADNGGSPITAYELRHSDDGGSNWSEDITTADAPAASAAITNLTNGTPYVAQVRARNSAGAGDWSGSSDGAIPITVPLAPNAFTLAVSMQTITASWAAPTDTGGSAIIRYELQYRVVGTRAWESATADADTYTLTIPNLTKGAEYEAQVYAVNGQGNGNPTEIMKITIPATKPAALSAPTLTGGNAQITAAWTAPDDGGSPITEYHVQHRTSAASTWSTTDTDNIATITDGTTSHPITGLTNGASYHVRVRAVNDIGTSDWSTPATGTTVISATQTTSSGTAATVDLSAAAMTIIADETPTVALTVVEPGTLAVSGSGDITVTAATAPGTVTPPTVDSGTGAVTVTATTTAGTYLVYGSKAGDILFAEYFYVTVSPADNAALDTAVAAGISNWGNTADLNYIVTTAVTDMTDIFKGTLGDPNMFNGDISGWDVSKVTTMENMFNYASAFNGDISGWDTSAVTSMNYMFSYAFAFNGDISGWDVSAVTNMFHMFDGARVFNGDISLWDVSKVTNMIFMFSYASAFNGDISGWNTRAVTNMNYMFWDAFAFNADISGWDVSNVTGMGYMFNSARAFNADISGWDVSSVAITSNMFNGARAFNQNLEEWKDHWSTAAGTLDAAGTYTGNKADMFTDSGVTGNLIPSWF